jgi:hypothetical protein
MKPPNQTRSVETGHVPASSPEARDSETAAIDCIRCGQPIPIETESNLDLPVPVFVPFVKIICPHCGEAQMRALSIALRAAKLAR